MFYNGKDDAPAKWTMRLSDAFEENVNTLELVVTVFNINYTKNNELLHKCHDLKCYSIFVDQVRKEVASGKTLRQAIKYCKEHDILADYFAKKEQEEVFDMVSFKWDWNRAMAVRAEEAAEQAAAKASAETADAKTTEFVLNMLREHEPYEKISRLASTSMENVKKIAHMNNLAYN